MSISADSAPGEATGRLMAEVAEADADPEQVDTLTRYLLSELRDLDGVDVALASGDAAPHGSKVVDPITIGGLIITLLTSQALPHVIEAVRGWLGRGVDARARSVKLQLDGESLELTSATADEQEHLVELFIARHQGDDPRT